MTDCTEIEQALLGAILVNGEALFMVGDLRPQHFAEPLHQRIFQAMLDRNGRGEAIDFITMARQFAADPSIAASGNPKYLSQLAGYASRVIRPADYAREITLAYSARAMLEIFQQAAHRIAAQDEPPDLIAAQVASSLEKLTTETDRQFIQSSYDVGTQIIQDLKDDVRPDSTGIAKLDEAMGGGLYPRKVYGVAARMKVGKTTLGATISHNLVQQKVPHMYVCLEMSAKEIYERMLCRAMDCYGNAFKSEYGKSDQFAGKLVNAVHGQRGYLSFWDAQGATFDEIKQKLTVAVKKLGIKGFILDYWQLVKGQEKGQSEASHLDAVAQWLAEFCRRNNVWSVTMAQINQQGNTRGSEGIKLAFDQIYQLRAMGEAEDESLPDRWLEMMATRYTKWANIGSETQPGLTLVEKGVYFEQLAYGPEPWSGPATGKRTKK